MIETSDVCTVTHNHASIGQRNTWSLDREERAVQGQGCERGMFNMWPADVRSALSIGAKKTREEGDKEVSVCLFNPLLPFVFFLCHS